MNGSLGRFLLSDFKIFFDDYKTKNTLAQESLTALEHFILALNEFFDLCDELDELDEKTVINNTVISWYGHAIVASIWRLY